MSDAIRVDSDEGSQSAFSSRIPLNRRLMWSAINACLVLMVLAGQEFREGCSFLGVRFNVRDAMLILVTVICSVTDLKWRKIPNWATYSVTLWAVVLSLVAPPLYGGRGSTEPARETPRVSPMVIESTADRANAPVVSALSSRQPWSASLADISWRESLAGAGGCFLIMVLICQFARYGAGDIKFATAIGAILGFERGITALIAAHVAAATVILVWLIWSIGPLDCVRVPIRWLGATLFPGRILAPTRELPASLSRPIAMAPFFAIGSYFAAVSGELPW